MISVLGLPIFSYGSHSVLGLPIFLYEEVSSDDTYVISVLGLPIFSYGRESFRLGSADFFIRGSQ